MEKIRPLVIIHGFNLRILEMSLLPIHRRISTIKTAYSGFRHTGAGGSELSVKVPSLVVKKDDKIFTLYWLVNNSVVIDSVTDLYRHVVGN